MTFLHVQNIYFKISSHFLYVTANIFLLTIGDQCASETTDQTHIDARNHQIIDIKDVDAIADLSTLNTGVTSKYDPFWKNVINFCALSVRDLVDQVKVRCSDDILIPSIVWVWLQFWPKTPTAKVALQYTRRLGVKSKVQQRQWRRDQIDSYFAAACFDT